MNACLVAITVLTSWYNYNLPGYPMYSKIHDTAASRDYPRGTELEVCSQDSPQACIRVRVNDFGPDKGIYPTRGLDLSEAAFKSLAPLSLGVIKVTVYALPR